MEPTPLAAVVKQQIPTSSINLAYLPPNSFSTDLTRTEVTRSLGMLRSWKQSSATVM